MPAISWTLGLVAVVAAASGAMAAAECGATGQCADPGISRGNVLIQSRFRRAKKVQESTLSLATQNVMVGRQLTAKEVADAMKHGKGRKGNGTQNVVNIGVEDADPLYNTVKDVENLNNHSTYADEAHHIEDALNNGSHANVEEVLDVINKAESEESVYDANKNGAVITADIIADITGGHAEDAGCKSENGSDAMCFQGDMEASDTTQLSLLQGFAKHAGNAWTNGRVNYCYATDVGETTRRLFERAAVQIHKAVPCITFHLVDNKNGADSYHTDPACESKNAIFVQSNAAEGCYSMIGMVGGTQRLQVQHPGCSVLGTTIHEIGHALGMHHEQSRPDRDEKVTLHWENIPSDKAHNFAIDSNEDVGQAYEYTSIMHYSSHAFSTTGRATITTPGGAHDAMLGERVGLAQVDANQLAGFYGCQASNIHAHSGCQDTDASYCGGIAHCSTTDDAEKCCGCGGGVLYQCWGTDHCPTRASQKLPDNPQVQGCLVDRTSWFNGAYPCAFENTCASELSVKCQGKSHGMTVSAGGTGSCCGLPAAGFDGICAGTCRVMSKSPVTPSPTPNPTPPTPVPTPNPTPPPTPHPTFAPTPPPATYEHCMVDQTALFGGAYECVVEKKCAHALVVRCPGHPNSFWPWTGAKGYVLPPWNEACSGTCSVALE